MSFHELDFREVFGRTWNPPLGFAGSHQTKIDWHFLSSRRVIYTGLAIGLILLVRRLFSRAEIRWYHAEKTALIRTKAGSEVSLDQLCKSITPPCFINPFMRNRHIQTLLFMFAYRTFMIYFRRMDFESKNPRYEGTFSVDFCSKAFKKLERTNLPPRTAYFDGESSDENTASDDSRPMMVVLHGLCGGSHEQYLQRVLGPLVNNTEEKWEACVLLSRGCGDSEITGGGMYVAHATSDIRQLVLWLRKTFPNRPLYAIGFSMGANLLTRYIAEEGDQCHFKAAVVLSNPWNLEITALHLQRTMMGRWFYSPAMTANLMNIFTRHVDKIKTVKGEALGEEPASQVHTMHEYDRYIQCPTWGFPTERVYYRQASSSDSVLDVRIPFWAFNAEDDPIVGSDSVPRGEFEVTPYTVLCTTSRGGHLGWFQSSGRQWYSTPVVKFLRAMHKAQSIDVSADMKESLKKTSDALKSSSS